MIEERAPAPLYRTSKTTGEMTEMNVLLAPLHHKPRGRVSRLPSPRRARQTPFYPPRYHVYYQRQRRPQPAGDFAIAMGCTLLAIAILLSLVGKA